ncbi:MAG: hypothetical protein R2932_40340 [Caldilineaceae bacterium]
MLDAVGLKANARPMNSQAELDNDATGQWDMKISRVDTNSLIFTNCTTTHL